MRSSSAGICLRVAVVAAVAVSGLTAAASASAAEPFGFSEFVSATCAKLVSQTCEPFTQAAGHPPIGLTVFKLNALNPGEPGKEVACGRHQK